MFSRLPLAAVLATIAALVVCLSTRATAQASEKISDQEFWQMVTAMSENSGSFVSDNIISNEIEFQYPIPELLRAESGGVYVGVGPEQNFTYITALKPSMAFIVDIRRGNLLLHLTYKALVELSADRVQFMSRLFARKAPAGIGTGANAEALFHRFAAMPVDETLARTGLQEILDCLERTHQFVLSGNDERGIAEIYRSLYRGGPTMRGDFGGGAWVPSYAALMMQTDRHGQNHSYLESEAHFQTLRAYESSNLIVPLVGDFAGRKTIRDVGRYVRAHQMTVGIFYTSNVEDYLYSGGAEGRFVANVSVLPIKADSVFIRSFFTHSDDGLRTLLDPIGDCLAAATHGDIRSYANLIARSKTPH